ncbi:Glycine cleavage system H protein [Musa troglodytarum]|uniref:Glycine cleavage system H protein n=1 Tax=Musa troglodytarum TaxID=320322 RepID=A0A9E7ET37_9LILI|nr:Glycine cleavage system H protein [Musa troglodytarum]
MALVYGKQKRLDQMRLILKGHGMLNLRDLDFEVSAVSFGITNEYPRKYSKLIDLKYSDTHEWVKVDGSCATIGITDHAQVVYVELPEVSATVAQGKGFGAVESVKATSDVNSPVSGEVVEVNSELTGSPGLGASFMGSKAFLDPTR